MKRSVLAIFLVLTSLSGAALAQVTSLATGTWSSTATWSTGAVPKATDDVVIAAGTTVTLDVKDAACKNITADGTLTCADADSLGLTINGSVTVNATGKINTFSTGSPAALRNQIITIMGDLTVLAGGNFDMRRGSNPNVSIGTVIFAGSSNSTIKLSQTTYGSSIEEFNSIMINKTGKARVILKEGNLYMSNNSTTGPTIMTLKNGIVEVQGTSIWAYLATSSTNLTGACASSYFIGNLGRGMSNSSEALRVFPVGDSLGLRPVVVKSRTSQGSTGAMVIVQAIKGDANNSSKFAGGIDKVSGVRYYKVTYSKGASGAASLTLDSLAVSYGSDDGVAAGNKNLRVAYSTDYRANWTGIAQTIPHTTALGTVPTTIYPDTLSTPYVIADGKSIYLALARNTGTKENTLTLTTGVEKVNSVVNSYELTQNYPNPFNPSTSIMFSVKDAGMISLNVYNALGQLVKSLVNEYKGPGSYKVTFDAGDLSSGMYIYTLKANNYSQTRKMALIK